MNIEQLREYCLQKPATSECFPFDEDTLVFKVCGKMFVLVSLEANRINVKCDPDKALELREQYAAVVEPYHMHKTQWNTVYLDGSVPSNLIMEWIDDSYELVIAKLPKKVKAQISIR